MGRVVLLDFDELPHPPDGPFRADTFLFLHGFGGDKRELRHIAEPFAEQGARCILPSLRGHGASPAPPFGYSCLDLAADVHRLMAQIAARCHLVGYSHGALVGAVTAVAMRPGVRSLVSIPAGFARQPLIEFTLYTALGSAVWNTVLVGAGHLLGSNWDEVEGVVKPISYVVYAAVVVGVVFVVYRLFQRRSAGQGSA